MARAIKRRGHSQRYGTSEFRPYVTALGKVALAWNDLLESLAALFWTLSNPPPREGDRVNYAPLHVWHSQRADRQQIAMLQAVVSNSVTEWRRPQLKKDFLWLIEQVNNLADVRNDAIHSPLFSTSKSAFGFNRSEPVSAADWLFNPRAINLASRQSILDDFVYCKEKSILLCEFALAADTALVNKDRLWPTRPSLPSRPPKANRPAASNGN